jgi:hypothetical protein
MNRIILGLISCALFTGCGMKVNFISKTSTWMTPKPPSHPIIVFQMGENLPSEYVSLGSVSVGEKGMTIKCGFDDVINAAKKQARTVGGDAIQILQMNPIEKRRPTCFNLIANVLVINSGN